MQYSPLIPSPRGADGLADLGLIAAALPGPIWCVWLLAGAPSPWTTGGLFALTLALPILGFTLNARYRVPSLLPPFWRSFLLTGSVLALLAMPWFSWQHIADEHDVPRLAEQETPREQNSTTPLQLPEIRLRPVVVESPKTEPLAPAQEADHPEATVPEKEPEPMNSAEAEMPIPAPAAMPAPEADAATDIRPTESEPPDHESVETLKRQIAEVTEALAEERQLSAVLSKELARLAETHAAERQELTKALRSQIAREYEGLLIKAVRPRIMATRLAPLDDSRELQILSVAEPPLLQLSGR